MLHYLLGELSESAKAPIEEQLFRDEHYFAQLQLIEDQLVDDYVCEALPPAQRQQFETGYLISARRRQKLQLAQELKKTLATLPENRAVQERITRWQAALAFWPKPVWRAGLMATALVLLLIGSWFVMQSGRTSPPVPIIANVAAPPPQPTESPRPTPQPAPATIHSTAPPRIPATIVSVLSPGLLRDDTAATPKIVITTQVTSVTLQLKYQPNPAYSTYRAVLETVAGKPLFTRDNLKPTPQFLRLTIPAQTLATNDYVLNLSGKNAQGEYEEVNDYSFRVVKK